MELDWIIASVFFLLFIAGAFTIYFSAFPEISTLEYKADVINDKVISFLKPDGYRVPIEYSSGTSGNMILYFNFEWPFGKDSTKIYSSSSLQCQIIGDRVYFQANVIEGNNYFTMKFSDEDVIGCDSTLDISAVNISTALAMEKEDIVSNNRLNEMLGTDYETFKSSLGIEGDFRVDIDGDTYGPKPLRNTVVREINSKIRETGENTKIRLLVW